MVIGEPGKKPFIHSHIVIRIAPGSYKISPRFHPVVLTNINIMSNISIAVATFKAGSQFQIAIYFFVDYLGRLIY